MKKVFLLLISAVLTVGFTGCSEEAYNEKYLDPSKVTSVSVDKLMTGVFLKAREFSLAGYNRYFGYDRLWVGHYAQTFGFYKTSSMYTPGFAAYVDGRWGTFYDCMTQYRFLEKTYGDLSAEEQVAYEAYYLAAKIHFYDFLLSVVDVYGNMPYSEACMLPITSDVSGSYAKFDNAETIYKMMLDDLKTANTRFIATVANPRNFATQDFINEGNFDKWQRYANSLRLRIALRVASQGALAADGKTAIAEILNNPQTYPLVEDNDQNIYIWNRQSGELNQEGGGGLGEWSQNNIASEAMVSRMTDDPRLQILYNLTKDNVYRGADLTWTAEEMDLYSNGDNMISRIREGGFFWNNKNWDHLLVTAAEVWFGRAEAYQKGWATGNAEEAFKNGVTQSIKMYYKYEANRTGSASPRYAIPSDTDIADFANDKWTSAEYLNKEDAIITQKWVHYGILFCREAWNDIRRTGYPSGLIYPEDRGSLIPNVPNRWKYPYGEVSYNPHYKDVVDYDKYDTKLFWDK